METKPNPLLKFLDATFLWLPDDKSPGFAAVGLFLVCQVTLPFILVLAPCVPLVLLARGNLAQVLNPASMPGWVGIALVTLLFGGVATVQELSRYAFVRHAERPLRALILFTG